MEKIAEKFKMHNKDVGSTALQIISFTNRILNIAEHVKRQKKDKHCRVGIISLVNKRKAMLRYLKKTNSAQYGQLIKELGLRG